MPPIIDRERRVFSGGATFTVLPDVNGDRSLGETIPIIPNIEFLQFVNVAPITVTNIKGGGDFRSLTILGDGFTTLDDNANIVTNTGLPKLLLPLIYRFTYVNGVWYEDAG